MSPVPSNVLFLRHAETDMAGTFCGCSDPELNIRGEEQIADLLRSIAGETIHAVYSSDLRRARSTAEAIAAARKIRCIVRPALREIDFGRWEGRTWSEIERSDPLYAADWLRRYPELPAPGGEAFFAFEARVLREIRPLLAAEHRPMAIVTHAGVLRVVLRRLCGASDEDAWRRTAAYCSVIRYHAGAEVPA